MHQMKHATGEGLLFISDRLANAQRLVAPVRPISEAQAKVAGTEIVCDRGKLSCKTALTDRELEIHVQSACNESAEDAGFANHGNPRMSKLRRINSLADFPSNQHVHHVDHDEHDLATFWLQ